MAEELNTLPTSHLNNMETILRHTVDKRIKLIGFDGETAKSLGRPLHGQRIEVSPADWNKSIIAVEASLKVRRSNEPGSRDYLDYVRRFIEERRV